MTPSEALRAAQVAGVEVALDGSKLVLEASVPPSDLVLEALSRNKAGIIALLSPRDDGWSAEDWQAHFDERAGIAEFDGGLRRSEAETQALAYCVTEWLNRNPVRSPAGRCLSCGGNEQAHDPLLPSESESSGHAWLHHRCWKTWQEDRKALAVAALSAIGLNTGASGRDQE